MNLILSYKRSKIWILVTITLIVVSLLFTAIFRGARWVAIPMVGALIMLILFCPILIIDIKNASGGKKDKKEEAKKIDLKRAEIELEREKLEVEKLKLQQGIIEEAKNYCKFCGEPIVGSPNICPHCGTSLGE